MALDPPSEVVTFLNVIGVGWPLVNEDTVRDFAGHVRTFASNIENTHQAATATITDMGQAYQGASYDALVAKWAEMSSTHMTALIDGCNVLAEALDVAADYIVQMKMEAIAELVGMAISFVADQAASVFTLGLAEAAEALIIEAGEKVVEFLKQELVQYIISQVVEAAVKPLMAVVEKAVNGFGFQATESILGVTGDSGSLGPTFGIDPDALTGHAATMRGHAQTVAGHAATFKADTAGMDFR
jgi:uncharacterized protein YukE